MAKLDILEAAISNHGKRRAIYDIFRDKTKQDFQDNRRVLYVVAMRLTECRFKRELTQVVVESYCTIAEFREDTDPLLEIKMEYLLPKRKPSGSCEPLDMLMAYLVSADAIQHTHLLSRNRFLDGERYDTPAWMALLMTANRRPWIVDYILDRKDVRITYPLLRELAECPLELSAVNIPGIQSCIKYLGPFSIST